LPIGFVRQQEDSVTYPIRGPLEPVGERGQDFAPVDSAGRIVRRVDDHQPRSRSDRRIDRVEVEIEARLFQRHLPRDGVGGEQHRFVTEPGRLGVDGLVTYIEDKPESDRNRREGAGGEGDVRRFELKAELPADLSGEESLRCLLAGLVGEPVLVPGHRPLADCRDDSVEGHLVRIAESEVRDAGIGAPLAVTRVEIEVLHSVESVVRRCRSP
jgi:hypothetical protein